MVLNTELAPVYTELSKLKEAGQDKEKIRACLEETEEIQTKEIAFEKYMHIT